MFLLYLIIKVEGFTMDSTPKFKVKLSDFHKERRILSHYLKANVCRVVGENCLMVNKALDDDTSLALNTLKASGALDWVPVPVNDDSTEKPQQYALINEINLSILERLIDADTLKELHGPLISDVNGAVHYGVTSPKDTAIKKP